MWLTWLADAARLTGYPVQEDPGWKTRGHGEMKRCEGVVGHHTGTPASRTGDYPTLEVIRNGRSNLAGPLAHLGLGHSGKIYVIAAGNCYHAGVSQWAGFTNLNDEFVGIEAESAGNGVWTDAQRDAYPKLVGALLYKMQRGPGRYISHRACALPGGRKDDPVGLPDEWMRTHAVAFMNQLSKPPPPIGPGPTPGPGAEGPASLPTLRQNDRGDDVMALHQWMTRKYRWAADMFAPTGFYGPVTVKAVKEFQARVGITGPGADGTIIGPQTNAALWAEGYRGVR